MSAPTFTLARNNPNGAGIAFGGQTIEHFAANADGSYQVSNPAIVAPVAPALFPFPLTVPPANGDPFWNAPGWTGNGTQTTAHSLVQGLSLSKIYGLWRMLESITFLPVGSKTNINGQTSITGTIELQTALSGGGAWAALPYAGSTVGGAIILGDGASRAAYGSPLVAEFASSIAAGSPDAVASFALAVFIDPSDSTKYCVAYALYLSRRDAAARPFLSFGDPATLSIGTVGGVFTINGIAFPYSYYGNLGWDTGPVLVAA
jgi:hypothetical protein